MRPTAWIGVSLAVVLIAGASTGGWYLYQHRLSDDVKRLLVAANDEHASQTETRQYVTQARPLLRTKRDREVLGQFEEALALLDSVQQDRQEDAEEIADNERAAAATDLINDGDECYAAFRELWKAYGSPGTGVYPSTEMSNESHKDLELGEECKEKQRQAFDARVAREKRDMQLSLQDWNSVRKAIGLPLLPPSKQ